MVERPGLWRRGWEWALDWIYPGVCAGCGETVAGGRGLCAGCEAAMPSIEAPFCGMCSEPFEGRIDGAFACPNCRGQRFSFEFARSGVRRSPEAMAWIHQFKYNRRIDLGRDLARLAARAFVDRRLERVREEGWPLVPVPLHWRRKGWRRFNQAKEIALPLGKELGLPVKDVLRRVRATRTQTRLSRKERQQNLRGAFRIRGAIDGWPGAVLVDDVLTTGSTVDECARMLVSAGVQNVVVVTVMRG